MSFVARRRPRAPYVPIAQWQDTRGYVLSDRIWHLNETTSARIDALLEEGIAQGRAAVGIARDLEGFLRPARRQVRTLTPYGTDGSYDARRLTRSEITRASSVASQQARLANPYVVRAFYHLSASHKADPGDPCERWAAQSDAQGGWPPGEEPLPMIDTHPHCLCYTTGATGNVEAATARIRADYEEARRAGGTQRARLTPLATELFIAWLMGRVSSDVFR